MAKFTIPLSDYITSFGGNNLNEQMENGIMHLFDFQMPWYSENSEGKSEFMRNFTLKYFNEEIGYETIAQFKLQLMSKLSIRMPYYQQLWDTMQIKYDAMKNIEIENKQNDIMSESGEDTRATDSTVDKTGTHTDVTIRTGTDTFTDSGRDTHTSVIDETVNKSETNGGNSNKQYQDINSDNPQSNFANVDYANNMKRGQEEGSTRNELTGTDKAIGNNRQTDEFGKIKSENRNLSDNSNSTIADKDVLKESLNQKYGKKVSNDNKSETSGWNGGSRTEELMRLRKAIVNINELLINECDDLFMSVFNSGYMEFY